LTTQAASDLLLENESKESAVLAKLSPIIVTIFCLLGSVNAAAPVTQQTTQVFINPECKDMFYGPDFVDLDASGKVKPEIRPKPDYLAWDPTRAKPMVYVVASRYDDGPRP
jgi:hypothetical protein